MTIESRRKFLSLAAGVVTAALASPAVFAGGRQPGDLEPTGFALNETGWLIYRGLKNGKSKPDIARQLCARYDISPEQAQSDVDSYTALLEEEGLLV